MTLSSETRGKKVETLVDYMICDGCSRKIRLRSAKKHGSGWFRVQIFSVGDKMGVWRDVCSIICLQLCEVPWEVKERSYKGGGKYSSEGSGEQERDIIED